MLTTTRVFLFSAKEDAAYADALAQELGRLPTTSGKIVVTKVREPTLLAAVGAGTQPNDLVMTLLSQSALKSQWLRAQVDTVVAYRGQLRLFFCSAQPIPSASLPPEWLGYALFIERPESAVLPAEAASRTSSLLSDAATTMPTAALRPDVPLSGPTPQQNIATIPVLQPNAAAQGYYPSAPYPAVNLPPAQRGFNLWTFIGATVLTTMIIIALLFASGALRFPRHTSPFAAVSTNTQVPTPTIPPTSTQPTQGQTVFTADWSLGLSGWSGSSAWQIANGALVSNCASKCNILAPFAATDSTANYAVDAEIAVVGINNSDGFFGPIARVQGDASQAEGYIGGLAGLNGSEISGIPQLSYIGGGTLGTPGNSIVVGNVAHDYRLQVRGSQISLFIDGVLESQTADSTFQSGGRIGLRASVDAQIRVSSLTVTEL